MGFPGCRQSLGLGRNMATVALVVLLLIQLPAGDSAQEAKGGKKKEAGGKGGKGGKVGGASQKLKRLSEEGFAAAEAGNLDLCSRKFAAAAKLDPTYSDYHTQLATCLRGLGRKQEAMQEFELARLHMDEQRNRAGGDMYWASVHINLGYLYAEGGGAGSVEGGMAKAAQAFAKATELAPQLADAYSYLGNALSELGDFEKARNVYQKAIDKVVPKSQADKQSMLYFHLAGAHGNLGDTDKALKAYKASTKANPKFAASYTNMGTIYQGRKQNEKARDVLEIAVQLDGQLAEAYTNLGVALQDVGDKKRAVVMTRTAIELKPTLSPAQNNYGRALENDDQLENALSAYYKAIQLSGESYSDAFCAKVYLEHFLCEWDTLDHDMGNVAEHLRNNLQVSQRAQEPCVQPFRAFAYPLPHDLFRDITIKIVDQERNRIPAKSLFQLSSERVLEPISRRLRIGYMSSDFGGHTVGSLIRNLLKMHNRHKVGIYGIGMMKGDGTEWNIEMERSTDKFVSIHGMTDDAAAFAVDSCEVHILIDLNGHSKGSRVGVLLRRPAPIITSFLGYPSTSGNLDDSIISDQWVTPPETKDLYTEKMVYLPHSYFVNDHKQLYPRPFKSEVQRKDHGLMDSNVVLGNFGQLYKVEPRLFDVWSNIIRRVSNSTLWLLKFPEEAVKRLDHRAKKKNLEGDKFVMSGLLPIDSHLDIKATADIGLDTVVFNGHTTAADTLWTGLPLICLSGVQMRSRAGASMAYSLGVKTWLVRNLEDYENVAVKLAANRGALRKARAEMERAVTESPFFDTALWAKGFERAWFIMWDTFQSTGERARFHVRAVADDLDKQGTDWEPQGIMIGTTRNPRKVLPGQAQHDPLGASKSSKH